MCLLVLIYAAKFSVYYLRNDFETIKRSIPIYLTSHDYSRIKVFADKLDFNIKKVLIKNFGKNKIHLPKVARCRKNVAYIIIDETWLNLVDKYESDGFICDAMARAKSGQRFNKEKLKNLL